ncbi:hypothetical protein [Pseudoalteromonas sp. 20-MNA-CIBAN-0454]
MTFDNVKAYQNYLNDEHHDYFVKIYWLVEVDGFMELDLEPFSD